MGETPFVQVSMTWALTCPEKVHQRPCMTREIETWLWDSSVVDHRSRNPVLITASTDVMSDHIGRQSIQGMEMDALRHQHTQANLDLDINFKQL